MAYPTQGRIGEDVEYTKELVQNIEVKVDKLAEAIEEMAARIKNMEKAYVSRQKEIAK